jgi:hypothetical protein
MSAVAYRLRTEVRARWRAWFGIALLVGIGGGLVTAAVIGARRTETAHDRFLSETRAADAGIQVPCMAEPDDCTDTLAALPVVEDMTIQENLPGAAYTADGALIEPGATDPCFSGPGNVEIVGDRSNRLGNEFHRRRYISGRTYDPARRDEAVISETIAERHHLAVGDRISVTLPVLAGCNIDYETPGAPALPRRTWELTVVGVHRMPLEIRPASSLYFASVGVTPAFLEEARQFLHDARTSISETFAQEIADEFEQAYHENPLALVALTDGAGVADLKNAIQDAGLADFQAEEQGVYPGADFYDPVSDGHRPYAVALAVAAAVGFLAVAAVIMPLLLRRLRMEAGDNTALLQLGATPASLRALAAIRAAAIALPSALVTVVVAVALSPFTPIGPARTAEPDPGLAAPAGMLLVAAIATAAFVFLAALPTILRVSAPSSRRGEIAAVGAVARQLSVPGWCGTRVALSRAAHAGTGVISLTIATAMVLSALAFSAGVQHLLSTPRLVGANFDAMLAAPSEDGGDLNGVPLPPLDEFYQQVVDDPDVSEYALATIWSPFWHGEGLRLDGGRDSVYSMAFDPSGTIEPSLISGRAPSGPEEIMVGAKTLRALDKEIGDDVSAQALVGEWDADEPLAVDQRYRIVGTGVLYAPDSLGHGAAMTFDGMRRLDPNIETHGVWVHLAEGTDPEALVARLYGEGIALEEVFYVSAGPLAFSTDAPLDIEQVDVAPLVIAGLLGLLGIAVLAHLVVSGLSANRRPFAVLAALGLTSRQRRATVRWQACTFLVVPIVLGIPLGVAIGRVIFREYAERLGVVPEPVTPWLAVAIAVPAALLAVALVTFVPARVAARAPLSPILRAE